PADDVADLGEVRGEPDGVDVADRLGHLLRLDPGETSLSAGPSAVATVREEELGLTARAEARQLDTLDARLGEQQACHLRAVGHPVPRGGEGAHPPWPALITPPTAPGADGGVGGPYGGDAGGEDAGRQSAPAGVEHRRPARSEERDRQAVGDEDEPGEPWLAEN